MEVGGETLVTDQGIRPDTNLEALSQLKPVFKPDGKITAGNASQISDGAAAVLLMSAEKAEQLGLRPRARIVDQTTVGCDPVKMLEGPIPATRRILERNSMSINDIDLIEINEAFAPVVAAWRRELDPDMDRVNVNGGAMALGHPLGSTGARLITTLLHELERSDKEIGFVTMCCGGGLGTATADPARLSRAGSARRARRCRLARPRRPSAEVPAEELGVRRMLMEVVGGQHRGDQRDVGLHLRSHQRLEDRFGDELVAVDAAVDDERRGDHRVVAAAAHRPSRDERDLERAGDAEHVDTSLRNAQRRQFAQERGTAALQQAFVPGGLNVGDTALSARLCAR